MGSIFNLKAKQGRLQPGKIDASLNQKLNQVEWGEFKLGELFDVENWIYGKNKQYKTKLDQPTKESVSVVSGLTENNGVNYYTLDNLSSKEIYENELTISTRGEYSGTVFYHSEKFVLANNILVMFMPKLTKNQKIFIGSLINSLPYGGYSGYPRKETLAKDTIQLPIKKGAIDFEFMESFIAELESRHIAELESYLQVTGLKDYNLSENEQFVLNNFNKVIFKTYKAEELFEIKSTQSFNTDKLVNGCDYDYVTRTSLNQGILKPTGFINKENINPKGVWSLGLLQMDFFYRHKPWYAGQFVRKITPKILLSAKTILYFSVLLNKLKPRLLSVLIRDVDKVFNNSLILLPIKNGEIDFEYMETFISAIQKLVIKDVVLYSERKINETKKIVNNN